MNKFDLTAKNIAEGRLINMDNHNRITCDAQNCHYNDGNDHCTAAAIKVGTHQACCCDDTRCATFTLESECKDCK